MDDKEKPKEGLAGLKHWKDDLKSGLQVSLLALSFSLGIAQASGVAPVVGLVTVVTMGFAASIMALAGRKGPYLTVCGAAAGLTTIVAGAMAHYSGPGWDASRAFPTLCALGCLSGLIQIVVAKTRLAAKIGGFFPATVIDAMLAAIGAIIIVKQLAIVMGVPAHGHEFWEMLAAVPEEARHANPSVFALSLGCLVLIFFVLDTKRAQKLLPVPAIITIVALGTLVGYYILHLESQQLVQIPSFNPRNWLVMPDFANLARNPSGSTMLLLQLTLVGTIEGVATAKAIDGKDTSARRTDPDSLTFGVGIANFLGSFLGAIPGIPGGVKSGANVQAGARTQWSALFCAVFMLIFMMVGRPVVNLIPKLVLAAVLISIGWKMCEPALWQHIASIGREQLLVFAVTFFVTISTDLLVGIGTGIVVELLVTGYFVKKYAEPGARFVPTIIGLWKNPVVETDFQREGLVWHIHLQGRVTAFNHRYLSEALSRAPIQAAIVKLH